MRPNDFLGATTNENGNIAIFTLGTNVLNLLGSSAETSADNTYNQSADSEINHVGLTLTKGQSALLATRIYSNQLKQTFYFFIPAEWPEDSVKPEVDLSNAAWISKNVGRSAQMQHLGFGEHCLCLNIDKVSYTNQIHIKEYGEPERYKRFRYAPNAGRLICQYLLGEVEAQAIVDDAGGYEAEQLASEQLVIALEKYDQLKRASDIVQQEKIEMSCNNAELLRENEAIFSGLKNACNLLYEVKTKVLNLRTATKNRIGPRWFGKQVFAEGQQSTLEALRQIDEIIIDVKAAKAIKDENE